jgi:hypothetical protein
MKILSRPVTCANGPMRRTYRLNESVTGFSREVGQIVTIPAGELVTLAPVESSLGICEALWGVQKVWLPCRDIIGRSMPVAVLGKIG